MAMDSYDAYFLGALLTQLLFGVYLATFTLYVKVVRVKGARITIIEYGTALLFVLCTVTVVVLDVMYFFMLRRAANPAWLPKLNAAASSLSVITDFVSQLILIYRCWQVYEHLASVGIAPSIFALVSLGAGLCVTVSQEAPPSGGFTGKVWWIPLGIPSMSLSLAVNATVSSLMIIRIYLVQRKTRSIYIDSNGAKLSWILPVLLESAVLLFVAQLIFLVLFILEHPAFSMMVGPVTMIYGLNCTAIMVRIGMNRSFDKIAASPEEGISELRFNEGMSIQR